ncbi:hypothetical protein [Thalassospira sp.]|uniref:hypothetical protein n=1 Tax=Thalassospira sp. TaxID=1912094 RepID=UPI001B158318|nr:hypothetical protein [Thalassospira sp.]MBO6522104.1 hypothetical protein [Rhodospirillales bacterium]MBO6773782.1 hypothetical protein [Thalassospira sp.]
MVDKISFPHGNDWGVIGPTGDYKLPVASVLGHRFQLVDGKVVDRYGGVSDDEVRKLDADQVAEQQAADLEAARQALIRKVKAEASDRIAASDWKVDRARERDALNGTTTLQDVYAEREAIRTASDEAELAILDLTSLDEIREFIW